MLSRICIGSPEAMQQAEKSHPICSLKWTFTVREENVITFLPPDLYNLILMLNFLVII